MRPINTEIKLTVFTLVLRLYEAQVSPEQTLRTIRYTTDENIQDLIPELAHCVAQAKAGLNNEAFEYYKAVLDSAYVCM